MRHLPCGGRLVGMSIVPAGSLLLGRRGMAMCFLGRDRYVCSGRYDLVRRVAPRMAAVERWPVLSIVNVCCRVVSILRRYSCASTQYSHRAARSRSIVLVPEPSSRAHSSFHVALSNLPFPPHYHNNNINNNVTTTGTTHVNSKNDLQSLTSTENDSFCQRARPDLVYVVFPLRPSS